MWTIFKYAAVLVALGIAGVLIVAARKPDSFAVARTVTIKAPADRIYPLIESPRAFNTWNPFLKLDPATKITYRGPEHGKGAAHDWDGNRNVGKGSFEIIEAEPPRKVVMRLDMLSPIEAHNRVEFALVPKGEGTDVSWTMSGPTPFVAKVMHTLFSMDRMVGGSFERGLADLKAQAEK